MLRGRLGGCCCVGCCRDVAYVCILWEKDENMDGVRYNASDTLLWLWWWEHGTEECIK